MKFTKTEMTRWPDGHKDFRESVTFDAGTFEKNGRLRDLKNVVINGSASYDDAEQSLYVEYEVSGTMVLPCAITLEDVYRDFKVTDNETFSFRKLEPNEEAVEVKGEIVDLMPSVYATIMADVPWIVHKEGLTELPKGNGWAVMTEEQYQKEDKGIDPRLAKLLQYKPEED